MDHANIASVVFSQPPVATVGIHPTAAEFVTMREPVPEPEKQAAE